MAGVNNAIDGDLYVGGNLRANSLSLPANCVGDNQVAASAGPIQYNKLQQQRAIKYAQKYGTAVVSERTGFHIGIGAGSVILFFAALAVPCVGAATVTIDLLRNGTTVLSGLITLNNSVTAFTSVVGTFSSSTYSSGDVYEVNVTATAGGGTIGQGLTVMLYTSESPT